ncbi:MAG: lysine--tRNA ligase, partial [Clostridia bacterium]|nr:lysine--tRNA ligase [Clostridia bacterium]
MDERNIQANNVEVDASEVKKVRIAKLNDLVERGMNPFEITSYNRTHTAGAIVADYEGHEGLSVSVAGRLMSKRVMGKASFGSILDSDGRIQVYFSRDDLGEAEYADFKKLDMGDIIGVEGEVFKTRTGETSIHAKKVTLLTKSLLPLPEKYHGLTNPELRYRQRYVDLIANPEVKELFIKRSKIVSAIREFLDNEGFYEVETPVLNTLAGGANARPFVTHQNTLDIDMYLRIAPELHLKRCIVGGFDKVYEVGRQFRNEGMDPKHNPEFTTVELYQAYTDYLGMMDITERLVRFCASKVCDSLKITYQGTPIDLESPWERLSMVDAVKKYLGMDFDNEPLAELIEKANKKGLEIKADETWGNVLYKVFDAFVEDHLDGPVFIYDYPVEVS